MYSYTNNFICQIGIIIYIINNKIGGIFYYILRYEIIGLNQHIPVGNNGRCME